MYKGGIIIDNSTRSFNIIVVKFYVKSHFIDCCFVLKIILSLFNTSTL